jgi:hypothetical protein
MESRDLQALTTTQVSQLSTANLDNLTTDQIAYLTSTQVAALTSTQLRSLSSTNLQAIESRDLRALTTTQVSQLTTASMAYLSTNQIQYLTTTQVTALTTSSLSGLTTDQVEALTSTQVRALTSTQLNSFSSTNLQAIETSDFQALTTAQISTLTSVVLAEVTSNQLEALTTTQLIALNSSGLLGYLTTTQTEGLNTCQITALYTGLADPLVLDLNGDGIYTTAVGSGVTFNLGGQKEATGWVGSGDGILVIDKDFGPNTLQAFDGLLPNGFYAVNGPTGMTAMDANRDGVLNSKDEAFKDLEVYTYDNGVGKLQTLSELNIVSVAVNMTETALVNNGNLVGLMGSFTTADGVTHSMADIHFQIAPVVDLARVIRDTNTLVNTGHVDLTKTETFKNLNVSLQDVLSVGENLSGVHQLTIDGTAGDTLHLADAGSGWHAAGTVTDGADSYMVYVNDNAHLLVNDHIRIVIG